MTPQDYIAFAKKFVGAIQSGDTATVRACYHPDAKLWHNNDGIEQTVDENMRVLVWMARTLPTRQYDVRQLDALPDGFVQQHVLRATLPGGGTWELPACVIVKVRDGLIVRLDDWWGGRHVAPMLPRVFFDHFPGTTAVADRDGTPVGFVCGFVSQREPEVAYLHFVGVDPEERGRGLGRRMYEWFFERVASLGCTTVTCVTSPANEGSRAFHRAMGFDERRVDDYDGRGEARMVMTRRIGDGSG